MLNRRQLLLRSSAAGLAMALANWPSLARADDAPRKKVLFFSKSSNFEHDVIKRKNGNPSFVENILCQTGYEGGIDFTFSKGGSHFAPDYLAQFDAYMFYTSGDLLAAGKDRNPPMTP